MERQQEKGISYYKQLGFKCGLEIHQQLAGKKLFCNCPAINSTKKPDLKVIRKLKAVAGELGMIDAAAMHEAKKGREFVYVSNSEDSCLVEYDEEPPRSMNKELLSAALQLAMLLNAKIVDEIQVMRKIVIDGSNTTGFQRTALVAVDGYIETSLGKVSIPTICLEEEAAQKLEETESRIVYKLDRLGIGLIEIATSADIKTPEHAKEAAEKIGLLLRSTGKVKRGIGTIRQDVNISISGGARTEIKGFQDLKSIPKVIEKEIERQLSLIKQGKKLKPEVRKAEPDYTTSFLRPMPGSSRMYPETDVLPVKPDLSRIIMPETIEEKISKYSRQYGLSEDLAKAVAKSEGELFEQIALKCKKIKPAFIAETIVSYKKELRRNFMPCSPELVKPGHLKQIFAELNKASIPKSAVMQIIVDIAKGKLKDDGSKLSFESYKLAEKGELEAEIKKIVEELKGKSFGAVMGEVMRQLKGKVDGKTASDIIKRLI